MAKNTIHLAVNFARSSIAGASNTGMPSAVTINTERIETKLPDLVVLDSFQLKVYCYDDYDNTDRLDLQAAPTSAILYVKRKNSAEDPVTLDAAGTTDQDGETEYWRLNFVVPDDTLTAVFDNQDLMVYAVVITSGSNERKTILMPTRGISASGTGVATLETSDIDVSTHTIYSKAGPPVVGDDSDDGYVIGDYIYDTVGTVLYRVDDVTVGAAVWTLSGPSVDGATLDAKTGFVRYLCDNTAGAITATLPTPSAGQDVEFTQIEDSNDTTIAGTITGVTTLTLDNLNSARLVSTASTFVNLNFRVYVS